MTQKTIALFILTMGLIFSSKNLLAAAHEEHRTITFVLKPRIPQTKSEKKVRVLIYDYMRDDSDEYTKKNSSKIRKLLKKISIQNPERLKSIIEQLGLTGYNVLHIAVMKNDKKLVEFLLKKEPSHLNAQTNGLNTPLHLAYQYKAHKVIDFLERQVGIDMTIENRDGFIPSTMPPE
jgi:ankyrin repeat protein